MASNNIQQEGMLPVGTILRGSYRIDSYLSSGGFGNTYKVTNIEFDEQYAVKEFFMRGVNQRDAGQTTVTVSNSANRTSFEEQREKFKKEARRLRQMQNKHLVRVHDLFEENGTAYYVMDFIDGESLADRLKRTEQPIPESDVRNYLLQILDALEEIHNNGFQHLDLKPANIMVDKQGQVTLIDFGASKQMRPDGGVTASTAICYTPGYAPREQMEQNYEKFGPWTDLYALGATLYNLLTTQKPPMPSDIDDEGEKAFSFPASVSDEMRSYILWLMQPNRMKRPQKVMKPTWKAAVLKAETKVNIQSSAVETEGDETIVSKPMSKPTPKQEPRIAPQPPVNPPSPPNDDDSSGSKIFWWIFLPAAIIILIVVGINNCGGGSPSKERKEPIDSVFFRDYTKCRIGDYFYEDGTYSHDRQNSKCVTGIVFSTKPGPEDYEKGWKNGYVMSEYATRSSYGPYTYSYPDKRNVCSISNWDKVRNDYRGYDYAFFCENKNFFELYANGKELREPNDTVRIFLPNNFSGWFVPSSGQLLDIFQNLAGVDVSKFKDNSSLDEYKTNVKEFVRKYPFVTGYNYWTSTEADKESTWAIYLDEDGMISFGPTYKDCIGIFHYIAAF